MSQSNGLWVWVWVFVAGGGAGGNVSGSLIISGALSRLSVCLRDALGVRCGPLQFPSVFPFVARPRIRGLRCSV